MTSVPIELKALPSRDIRKIISDSKPKAANWHWWKHNGQYLLFTTNGSQLFGLSEFQFKQLDMRAEAEQRTLLHNWGVHTEGLIDDKPLRSPTLKAISLAVAQKCNLACTYCYAEQGDFGGSAKNMSPQVAYAAIDELVQQAQQGESIHIAYLGGEPMANRKLIYQTTEYALKQSQNKDLKPKFAITTNGTLITPQDAEFFEHNEFAVTISLDGSQNRHDSQRPMKSGKGSYARIIRNIQPLLSRQNKMQVSARVTVTPGEIRLLDSLNAFLKMGFHSVGFSPMLRSPNGKGQMQQDDLALMLEQMIECSQEFERQTQLGRRYAFANVANALKEIDKGTHRPYPCGAGAGYMGVSAEGKLSACHRFVDDVEGQLGTLGSGIDLTKQNQWLEQRHVHKQSPCNECWAKYLCGGGCHHEVIGASRPFCDYVRGWLLHCLNLYNRLIN